MKKYIYIIFGLTTCFLACEELTPLDDIPVTIEAGQIDVDNLSAAAIGKIVSAGDGVIQYGHVWSIDNSDPIYSASATRVTRLRATNDTLKTATDFISSIDLETGNVYRIRPYAIDTYGNDPYYGKDTTIATAATTMADFSIENDNCIAPCNVTFTDLSANASSWSWDFGDGGTSDLPNPIYEFTRPGTYTVRLEVSGTGGTNAIEKIVVVKALTFQTFIQTDAPLVLAYSYLPVTFMPDRSYFVGLNSDGQGGVYTEIQKFSEGGVLQPSFNFIEEEIMFDSISTDTGLPVIKDYCQGIVDLNEVNNKLVVVNHIQKGYNNTCTRQYNPEDASLTPEALFLSDASPCFEHFEYHNVKGFIYDNGFTLDFFRIGMARNFESDYSQLVLHSEAYVEPGTFACYPPDNLGVREEATDGILNSNQKIIAVALRNNQELFLAIWDPFDGNSDGFPDIVDLGITNYRPIGIEELDNGNYLIVGEWNGNGLFALTLDSGFGIMGDVFEMPIGNLKINDVLIEKDGTFVAIGRENGNAYMAKFSGGLSNYTEEWKRNDFLANQLISIEKTFDTGFIMSGLNGATSPYLIKTGPDGLVE